MDQLLHPMFDPRSEKKVIAKGLNASPGAATGKVVFGADEADKLGRKGEKIILTGSKQIKKYKIKKLSKCKWICLSTDLIFT